MRLSALVLLLAVSALALVSEITASPVQTACPPDDDPLVRNHLKSALQDTRVRTQMEIMHVNPASLRPLTDPGDTQMCQGIMAKVQGTPVNPDHVLKYVFYTADNYYFSVIVANKKTGGPAFVPGELIIFDSALNEVHASIF